MSLGNTAKELAEFFKKRDPTERYDTIIIQRDGRTIKQYFERSDANRIVELMALTPLK
jgi:hypothetical protein